MSSDTTTTESQDFFYSPYPFDSPSSQSQQPPDHDLAVFRRPDSTHSSMKTTTTTVPPAVSKKKKVSSTQNLSYLATPPALPPPPPPPSADLMMLSWNEGVPIGGGGGGGVESNNGVDVEVEVGGGGERRKRSKSSSATFRQPPSSSERVVVKVKVIKQAALGLRICQVILCLLSFFVMVSDKTRGWSGDSYYRYREYRYLVGVNIIGCIHSGVEACDMTYCLLTGKHVISCGCHLRYYMDFFIDQIVAYLLMSASSAAATRTGDWVSNWGKDAFTQMANASIWLSFMAFFAFAFTSLFSAFLINHYH